MAEEAATTEAAPITTTNTVTTVASGGDPWYATLEPEMKGYVENRGLTAKTPLEAFVETAKAHRAAEVHIGVPAERAIRLPADQNPDAWREVWTRLGAPEKADGYDLSAVKRADGTDLDPEFASVLRNAAYANHLPKDAAAKIAADLVKFQEAQTATQAAAVEAKVQQAHAALKTSWGANFQANVDTAKQAAKALGATEAEIDALEQVAGYDKAMGFLLRIGEKMGEDTFVTGAPTANPNMPRTREGAQERIDMLKNDADWLNRWNNGGVNEANELAALMRQANPEAYAAAGV